jgi:hypothetical protein
MIEAVLCFSRSCVYSLARYILACTCAAFWGGVERKTLGSPPSSVRGNIRIQYHIDGIKNLGLEVPFGTILFCPGVYTPWIKAKLCQGRILQFRDFIVRLHRVQLLCNSKG